MSESSAETRSQLVRINYALLLIGLLTGGVTALVGAVIAHLQAPDAPEPHQAHFRFQYRTFWIGLLYNLIAGITTLALIGWLLLVIIVIWWIVRCVRGLNSLANGEPPSNLTTWGF
ncbi:MAG: hypothetical protein HUJ15_07380 [Alcanivorax sp.]|uniref:Transmembrane protein n=1 Tax=Alloalcanivorax venustensis ISO4 TaxID=1177184 RepID=A0ABS0ABQ9_9GAMM|nr:hypothetical protein [Alloalcanivorax venustensis]KXJ44392.1 MAG: hypothetical protein AXW13_04410 [Alcanivorax sp. Nap_24]MBA4731905.1 hypothetical protein [Alcanivorax sp.]MBD3651143.1 hypothetical protein [Alcanivorax sp.]MBF5051553.1 hypothetical protein [Alloalcanivorax venustensis ISO4]NQY83292.1 hypothetical protein [Alcanivorax sp.]